MSLNSCRQYLEDAIQCSSSSALPSSFDRSLRPSWLLDSFDLPSLYSGSVVHLCEFEIWVAEDLESWLCNVKPAKREVLCSKLGTLIETYLRFAQVTYKNNPKGISSMVLVVLDLWVAMDKLANQVNPLLKDFNPAIPKGFLEPLLLPKKSQMDRADRIEEYIAARFSASLRSSPSIFSDPSPESFAVRFFETSNDHQSLHRIIEEDAKQRKTAKKKEHEALMVQYESYREKFKKAECLFGFDWKGAWVHKSECQRCHWEHMSTNMKIRIFEWPLPEKASDAKAMVFELSPPEWFAKWRDVTWAIIHEIPERRTERASQLESTLWSFSGTQQFMSQLSRGITLGSSSKSWLNTHYREQTLPVDLDQVCRPCGLKLGLLDNKRDAWTSRQTSVSSVKSKCIFQLPHGPYSNLQFAVDSFQHTENAVLALQHDCHTRISQREFIAFGSLRAGENVQWINILRELAASNISFNEKSDLSLFKQTAWELGSKDPTTKRRISVEVFADTNFVNSLLDVLEERVTRIEGNWEQSFSLETFGTIGRRLLSLSTNGHCTDRALAFIRHCRNVALDWCQQLKCDMYSCKEDDIRERQDLLLRIAAFCQSTYDVDIHDVPNVLSRPNDLSCLIRSSILLFETGSSDFVDTKLILDDAQRVRCLLRTRMYNMATDDPTGLNCAIQASFNSLQISGNWSLCSPGRGIGWVRTQTHATDQTSSQVIHYDLLTGELLIDNSPPGRLPRAWMDHSIYKSLFGSKSLPVVPSNLTGSSFVSAEMVHGFEIHFGMKGKELVLKAKSHQHIFQLIPQDVLLHDFPLDLVHNYFQWLNLETGTLEFRPSALPWIISDANWHLNLNPNNGDPARCVMRQGQSLLVDPRSSLAGKIAAMLLPLESKENMTILQLETELIEIHLTRFRLTFYVDEQGMVVCKELDSVIDRKQDIGCLYGLFNKLVLRENKPPSRQSVIVPYGSFERSTKRSHIHLTVSLTSLKSVEYFQYYRDDFIGVLRAPLRILASYYQAYLHAMTTFPLPDPLTCRSGTEECLRILRQSMMCSSSRLSASCIWVLERIARLTPVRRFYPRHLRVMQTVEWQSSLSQLGQHDDFYEAVWKVVNFSARFPEQTTANSKRFTLEYKGENCLLQRARNQHMKFRHAEFGGSKDVPGMRSEYASRDNDITSERSRRVYEVATLVTNWPARLHQKSNLVDVLKRWGRVSSREHPLRDMTIADLLHLKISEYWVTLFKTCQSASRDQHSSFLRSLFSKIAFSENSEQGLLRQLLLVAFSNSCTGINPPTCPDDRTFCIDRGEDFIPYQVKRAIEDAYGTFYPRIEASLSRNEQLAKNNRDLSTWNSEKAMRLELCYTTVKKQWPCQAPNLPPAEEIPQLNVHKASEECKDLFFHWTRNSQFLNFVRKVQKCLDSFQAVDYVPELKVCPAIRQVTFPLPFQPPTLLEVIQNSLPREDFSPIGYFTTQYNSQGEVSQDLIRIAQAFEQSEVKGHRRYGELLSGSITAQQEISESNGRKARRPE
ncbi:hypothetical protein N7456_012340 [Penicillium angulare]|uniref:Uncharacterized protein n=1 Tax=Penicillium angulare TaxID=116970 RepID=A0A9W9K0K4_9EURO|nr:hypothetical protein N7456_012340 [Penicillium angulare]